MTRMPACVCTSFRDNKSKLKMEYCFASTEDFMKNTVPLLPVSYAYLILLFLYFGVINNPANNLHHTVFNDGTMSE